MRRLVWLASVLACIWHGSATAKPTPAATQFQLAEVMVAALDALSKTDGPQATEAAIAKIKADRSASVRVIEVDNLLGAPGSILAVSLQNIYGLAALQKQNGKNKLIALSPPYVSIDADKMEVFPFDDVIIVRVFSYNGSHHTGNEILTLTRKRDELDLHDYSFTNTIKFSAQIMEPFELRDLDRDGAPELIVNNSDYYVQSFAADVVDPNYLVFRFDRDTKLFTFVPWTINAQDSPAARANRAAVIAATKSLWQEAQRSASIAVEQAPESEAFRWNRILIDLHAQTALMQAKEKPSMITEALIGDYSKAARHRKTGPVQSQDPDMTITPQVLIRLFEAAAYGDVAAQRLTVERFYAAGASPSQLYSNPFSGIEPQLRSAENAFLTRLSGRIFYNGDHAAAAVFTHLARAPERPLPPYVDWQDEKPKKIQFLPFSIRAMALNVHETNLKEKRYDLLAEAMIANARARNYQTLREIIEIVKNDKDAAKELEGIVDYFGRIVDLRYGRFEAVVSSLIRTASDFPDLNAVEAYERLGAWDIAEDRYRKDLTEFDGIYPTIAILAHNGLGRVAMSKRDTLAAQAHFEETIRLVEAQPEPYQSLQYSRALLDLAELHRIAGRLEVAQAYLALAEYWSMRSDTSRSGWVSSNITPDLEILPKINLERARQAIADNNEPVVLPALAAALSLVTDVEAVIPDYLDRFDFVTVADEIIGEIMDFHIRHGQADVALMFSDSVRDSLLNRLPTGPASRRLALGTTIAPASTLISGCATGEVCLHYSISSSRLVLFLIRDGRIVTTHSAPVDRQALKVLIAGLYDQLPHLAPGAERQLEALKQLHTMLVEPVAMHLSDEERVVIIPGGEISRVPFAALLGPDGRHLVERFALSYRTSLRGTLVTQKLSPGDTALIVHSVTTAAAPPLRHSKREAEVIAAKLPPGRVTQLSGVNARLDRVGPQLHKFPLVHFATHFVIDPINPLDSHIVLSDPKSKLTLKALMGDNIQLRKGSLIVLSACRSAGGRIAGDGTLGFWTGLAARGAAASILTLWEIRDEMVPAFMDTVYDVWTREHDVARAVQTAQLAAIRNGVAVADWAAFSAFGQTRTSP